MYIAGMVIFADKGFAKPQMFLNLFISNAGLLVIAVGQTIVMITGGIDISVGSITALVCMVMANQMENHGMYCTGLPDFLSGDPAIHCQPGRSVLWPWYDFHGQHRDDFYQE